MIKRSRRSICRVGFLVGVCLACCACQDRSHRERASDPAVGPGPVSSAGGPREPAGGADGAVVDRARPVARTAEPRDGSVGPRQAMDGTSPVPVVQPPLVKDRSSHSLSVAHELLEVPANGLEFVVTVAGPPDGEALVLLHGFPETSLEWRFMMPGLVEAGYRIIAIDQRGYSPGARPLAVEAYSVLTLASDVLAIADAMSVRGFHLVGHDWGGGVAWLVAKLAPLRVMSLTAVSTPHPDAMKSQLDDTTSCQHSASAYFDLVTADDAASRLIAEGTDFFPEEYREGFLPDLQVYQEVLGDEPALDATLNWYRANIDDRRFNTLAMGAVDTPTLYVLGAEDRFFCRDTAELTAKYVAADYEFVVLDGIGHFVPEQDPHGLNALIIPHLAKARGRVAGAHPPGPDRTRPLGPGLSGFSCLGAPTFEPDVHLATCDDVCPEAHCLPAETMGEQAALAPDCVDGAAAGSKCVPDALSRSLGRVSLGACQPWLSTGPGVCVPQCMTGALGLLLGRGACAGAEVCVPCENPIDGTSTGACGMTCTGL